MLTTVLEFAAPAIFLIRLVPQPVRLARSGVAAGVSPLAAINALIADVAWTVYGVTAGLPVVWAVSLLAMIPGFWTASLLRTATTRRDLGRAGIWVGALVAAAALHVFAGALAAGVVVTHGPQVWKAVRDSDLSGIAALTWMVSVADALAWGGYGLAIGDPALLGYAVVLLASAAIVLTRVAVTGGSLRGEIVEPVP